MNIVRSSILPRQVLNYVSRRGCANLSASSSTIKVNKASAKDGPQDFVFCQVKPFEERKPREYLKPARPVQNHLSDSWQLDDESLQTSAKKVPKHGRRARKGMREDVELARQRCERANPLFIGPVPWQQRANELAVAVSRRMTKENVEKLLKDLSAREFVICLENASIPNLFLLLTVAQETEQFVGKFSPEDLVEVYHAYGQVAGELELPEGLKLPDMLCDCYLDADETVKLVEAFLKLDLLSFQTFCVFCRPHLVPRVVFDSASKSPSKMKYKIVEGFSGKDVLRVVAVLQKLLESSPKHRMAVKHAKDLILKLQTLASESGDISAVERFCAFAGLHSRWPQFSQVMYGVTLGGVSLIEGTEQTVSNDLARLLFSIPPESLEKTSPQLLVKMLAHMDSCKLLLHPSATLHGAHGLVTSTVDILAARQLPNLNQRDLQTVRVALEGLGYRDDYFVDRLDSAEARFRVQDE